MCGYFHCLVLSLVRQTADLFADEGYMVLVPDYYRYSIGA
jgi:dienelactone hydrolase